MAKTEPTIEIATDLLRRLHRIHRQLSDIHDRIARGPRRIAAGEAILQKGRQAIADATDAVKRTKLAADQKQLQLREREDRVEVVRGRQNEAASNREYDLLKEQIAADEQANAVLSDEILELLERIDQVESDRADRHRELDERLVEHERLVETARAEVAVAQEDLARIEAERQEAEQLLPTAARGDYTRLIAARGEDAFAAVDGETCGGCYQVLTTQLINRLMLSQLVRCPNCNAFLYQQKAD